MEDAVVVASRRSQKTLAEEFGSKLTARERLVALAHIARALLDRLEPAPELHAWNEAAVYAVYCFLRRGVRRSSKIRKLVAYVCCH
jgi:hypothetical protein